MTQTAIDQALVAKLRERGMRVTSQRLLIHRALCGQPQHMTAEEVRSAVADVLPGTSLPTVYATLELLEELGLVRRVRAGNRALLFDSRIEPHAHAICRQCGAVTDLEAPIASEDGLAQARRAGFAPDQAQLIVWGLCERCARG